MLPVRDLDKIPCSRKDQFYILVEDPNSSDVACGQTIRILRHCVCSAQEFWLWAIPLRIRSSSSRNGVRHLSPLTLAGSSVTRVSGKDCGFPTCQSISVAWRVYKINEIYLRTSNSEASTVQPKCPHYYKISLCASLFELLRYNIYKKIYPLNYIA